MPQLMVTKKLNRRSTIPSALPDVKSIVDTVPSGFMFAGNEVIAGGGIVLPPPPLNKWYKDSTGLFYWGGALLIVKDSDTTATVEPSPTSTLSPTSTAAISVLQIKSATASLTANAEKLAPFINDTCSMLQINTPIRILCFLAQVGHESGGLFYTEELASGNAYEGRADLGNTHPGDGVRFKGRGLIQITGRVNYTSINKDLGIDCINNPSLLGGKRFNLCTPEQLKNATLSAGWFWNKKNLNELADKIDINTPIDKGANNDAFVAITKKINGGTNGLPDRRARYNAGVGMFR